MAFLNFLVIFVEIHDRDFSFYFCPKNARIAEGRGGWKFFEQKINWGLTGVAEIDWGLAFGVGQWQLGFDERLFVRLVLVKVLLNSLR